MIIYTDAKELSNGSWVIGFISDDSRHHAWSKIRAADSNEAELAALEYAIDCMSSCISFATFKTDSMYALNKVNSPRRDSAAQDYRNVKTEHCAREVNYANNFLRTIH